MSENVENSENGLSKEAQEVVDHLWDQLEPMLDRQFGVVGSSPKTEMLIEMLSICDNGPTDDDIFAKMLSDRSRKDRTGAAGGPSRQWGSDAPGSVPRHRSIGNVSENVIAPDGRLPIPTNRTSSIIESNNVPLHRSIGNVSENVTAPDGRSTTPTNTTSPATKSANEPTDQPLSKTIRPSGYGPPLDNMGVTKYQNSEMGDLQTCTTESRNPHMGGYDGGAEIGFDGEWNLAEFNKLKEILETAKTAAEEKEGEAAYVTLADRVFRIMPRGSGRGVHYRYVLEGGGIKIYIHNNPQKNIQPLRIRYGFEALIGNSIVAVHDATLDWFAKLGFHVSDEKISRLDLQIMTERPVREYIELILLGHAIQRARKDHIHRECGKLQTFTSGSNIEICIYDKRAELVGNEIKTRLLAKYCRDLDLPEQCCNGALFIWENLTRIEFRLKREPLKALGINTLAELKEKELSLVAYLTEEWFRILAGPKVRGHENKQAIHPLWKEVQELFRFHFPGDTENRSEVTRGKTNIIKCTAEALVKQAMGCLSTVIALNKGVGCSISDAVTLVIEKVQECGVKLTERANTRAVEFGIVRAVSPDDFDPHTALDFLDHDREKIRNYWDKSENYKNLRRTYQ